MLPVISGRRNVHHRTDNFLLARSKLHATDANVEMLDLAVGISSRGSWSWIRASSARGRPHVATVRDHRVDTLHDESIEPDAASKPRSDSLSDQNGCRAIPMQDFRATELLASAA